MAEFNTLFVDQAFQFTSEGDDAAILARRFGVSDAEIAQWKKDHPEFDKAIEDGIEAASNLVVKSLFKRCTGYKYKKDNIVSYKGMVTGIESTEEEMPADVKACQYWLNNRKPEQWANNARLEISNVPTVHIKDLTGEFEMSDEDELVARTLIEGIADEQEQ